jgi:rod shape determining protein RodA
MRDHVRSSQERTNREKALEAVLKYMKQSDMLLLALCLMSTVYGIILIDSATRHLSSSSHVYTQVVALFIGLGLYIVFLASGYRHVGRQVEDPFCPEHFVHLHALHLGEEGDTGNKAWLRFGGSGIQPAEVVKIPYVIILAKMISDYKERRILNAPISFVKLTLVFAVLFGLIIVSSRDLGSALIYLFILIVMMYIGGVDLKWLLLAAAVLAAAVLIAWNSDLLTPLQKERILAPYDPLIDPKGLGVKWQPNKSKLAIAAGNFVGEGLFGGPMTQAGLVPKQHTDFIFSVAGEELGFIGCFGIIALLLGIIIRCFQVGIRSNSNIGFLVCTGITAMLIFQTFENIGMCLGLTPVIGLTLPFFSSGGSSIITLFAAMGIISGIKMRPKPARFRSSYL